MKKNAFTLIEVMIVCAIMMLILIPTYRIMSHGSKSAIKGVQRNNVVMQGQNIISQLKMDLALSGFKFVDDKSHGIADIFTESTMGTDIIVSFATFNGGETDQKVVPTNSGPTSFRRLNKVEYRLISKPDTPFKTLERTIKMHPKNAGGKTLKKVLSDQVNFFEIRPETVSSAGFSRSFFRISLQLYDQEEGAAGTTGKAFIADFMDTSNPLILNSIINNPGLNRNWYTDPHDTQ